MTQPAPQEFAEAVARGEYGQCVPLEQVRAIYAEGFVAGQERMRERAARACSRRFDYRFDAIVVQDALNGCSAHIRLLPIEDAPEPEPAAAEERAE